MRIFGAILGIINIILGTINRLTGKTSEWAKNLDFSPFLESVADFFESLEPLVKNVGDIFSGIYEKVLLPLGKWLYENFLKPVGEWTGGVIVSVIKGFADALKDISDWISEH